MGFEMNKTRGVTLGHVQSRARVDKRAVRAAARARQKGALRVHKRAAASNAGGARRSALAIAASSTERRISASLAESVVSCSLAVALARPETLAAMDCSGM